MNIMNVDNFTFKLSLFYMFSLGIYLYIQIRFFRAQNFCTYVYMYFWLLSESNEYTFSNITCNIEHTGDNCSLWILSNWYLLKKKKHRHIDIKAYDGYEFV